MNERIIKSILSKKLNSWLDSITDKDVREAAASDCIVTGGAITSLLLKEKPNDYDIYFKTLSTCKKVANYYANIFNSCHDRKVVIITHEDTGGNEDRVECYIQSAGVAADEDYMSEYDIAVDQFLDQPVVAAEAAEHDKEPLSRYRPVFFSSNAITLSDDIQLIVRFVGSADEIHKNFDFVHATCSYDYSRRELILPAKALTAILARELRYVGSKYPLASVIRARKFIQRGWTINAGQYLKMLMQLNTLDLLDIEVLKDQLTGVDMYYFKTLIKRLHSADADGTVIDATYIASIIDELL